MFLIEVLETGLLVATQCGKVKFKLNRAFNPILFFNGH